MHKKMQNENILCEIFLFEWIIAVYSNILDRDFCLRLWDSILFHGEYYIIKVAIAICHCLEEKLKQSSADHHITTVIKRIPEYVNEMELFHCLNNFTLTKQEYFTAKI